MTVLDESEIRSKLTGGWDVVGKKLVKEFELDDFLGALAFVNKVGKIAQELNHHPDILIHDYKKVRVETSTHDEGGVTEKDFELVGEIEGLRTND